jgi:hypothetical protein
MSLLKNRPKCGQTFFSKLIYITYTVEKISPKSCYTFLFFIKLPQENNPPKGKNSPNLVTLVAAVQ